MKLKELFERNNDGKLILPNFQRDFEWARDKQKSLLSSYLTGLPVGSLLILEGKKENFAAKKLCFPTSLSLAERKDECLYLLDGQQRISSLKSIFSDYYHQRETWLPVWEKMYSDLNNRWFIRAIPKTNETDIFGWKMLGFSNKGFKEFEPVEIIEFIEWRKIFKTKVQDWFNPGYSPKDNDGKLITGNRLKVNIAKKAAEAGLIPLYSIFKIVEDEKPLHEYVIEQLKNNRIDELKALVKDEDLNLIDILEPIDPMISDYIDDEDKVRDAWSTLGAKWTEKVNKFLNELLEQEIPIIQLPSDEISRAISIFENINEGGTDLNTFDLIVAKAARAEISEDGSLSQRIIKGLEKEITLSDALCNKVIGKKPSKFIAAEMNTIVDVKIAKSFKEMYLNTLSIFSHLEYGEFEQLKVDYIKRNKILNLNFEQINSNTNKVLKALIRSLAFLNVRLGITEINKLSYELMILPIAYLLKEDHIWGNKEKLDKIEYWYWASLFGGAYRDAQNSQSIRDISKLYSWIVLNEENKFKYLFDKVLAEEGYSNEETLLQKDENNDLRGTLSLGILQYILSKQPKDFLPTNENEIRLNAWDITTRKLIVRGENTIQLDIHDHHIIPLGDATTIDESSKKIRGNKKHILNSPLNRTYISSVANLKIRDKSPDKYLQYVNESSKWGHCLPEGSINTDYEAFLKKRYLEIKKEIKKELEILEG